MVNCIHHWKKNRSLSCNFHHRLELDLDPKSIKFFAGLRRRVGLRLDVNFQQYLCLVYIQVYKTRKNIDTLIMIDFILRIILVHIQIN